MKRSGYSFQFISSYSVWWKFLLYFSLHFSEGEILKGQSCKRKQLWEDVNLFKKLKIDEDKSGKFSIHYILWHCLPPSLPKKNLLSIYDCFYYTNTFNGLFLDIGDKIDDHSGSIARNQFTCSYASKNLKRIREDEAIVAANYKRIR